jgi:hypothetical protein
LRFLRFVSPGEYRTPTDISIPATDAVSLGVLGAGAQVVLARNRYPTIPAEYHLTHVPSMAIYPSTANFLQVETLGMLRVPPRVVLVARRRYPYARQGSTVLLANGAPLPPNWVRESTLGPTAFAAPLAFWWDAAATSGLYTFAITDPWASIAARHQLLSTWCAQYQTPYRGATPLCWDIALIGGAMNVTYTALTVSPTATWHAGRRALAILSLGSQIPSPEAVNAPPGWSLLASDRPDPQPPAGWGSKLVYTRILTGTEGPQTWQWTTPAFAALLIMIWGTEEQTPPGVQASLSRLGSYTTTATSAVLTATTPAYAAIVWMISWWKAYYNVPFPTDDAGGVLRPGAFNILDTGITISGTGTQSAWSTTWTWASGVRGHSGVFVLTAPMGAAGLRMSRMGILAAPRPRRRPGPG